MDIAIYIPTFEAYGEQIPGTIGVAYFDLMSKEPPSAEVFHSLCPMFSATLQRIVADSERVWIGPNMNAALHMYAFTGLDHPQLRDSETLFSLVPHVPGEYPRGASPKDNALAMAARLRSCVDALLISGL